MHYVFFLYPFDEPNTERAVLIDLEPGGSIGSLKQEGIEAVPDTRGGVDRGDENFFPLLGDLFKEREGFFKKGPSFRNRNLFVIKGLKTAKHNDEAGSVPFKSGDLPHKGMCLMASKGAGDQDPGEEITGVSSRGLCQAGDKIGIEAVSGIKERDIVAVGQGHDKELLGQRVHFRMAIEEKQLSPIFLQTPFPRASG